MANFRCIDQVEPIGTESEAPSARSVQSAALERITSSNLKLRLVREESE